VSKSKIILLENFLSLDLINKIKKKYIILPNNKKNYKYTKVIFTKLKYFLDKKFLESFPNLKIIVSPTTGLTHIDLDFCKKKKIKIIHLKSKNKMVLSITSTTELILTFVCMGIKRIINFNNSVKKGFWKRYDHNVMQFRNYTVGIIGLGRIGRQLKKILETLNFKVMTYDINDHNKKQLSILLQKSDIISLNISSSGNSNFFSKSKFDICKRNLIFINTSRGEVVDEKQMFNFFKKNKSAQCFVDVLKNEQYFSKKFKYLKKISNNYPNVFITPHIGGASKDAIVISERVVIEDLLKYEH
jgi:D-3-phosphoglycerate dehydrogenase